MNLLDSLFIRLKAAKRKAFMPFLSAGDPDLAFTQQLVPAIARAGADLLEIGFPFSDPVADGPTIQASYTRALKHGLKITNIFQTLGACHKEAPQTPLVAMASYSLIHKKGQDTFLNEAIAAGLSGVVVPDLPVEESAEFGKRCRDRDFKMILLVTPTTSESRAVQIVQSCSGFVYVVSVVGITGQKAAGSAAIEPLMKRLRNATDLPLCIGFGVSTVEHVRDLRELADGIIVGSALVKKLEQATNTETRKSTLNEIERYIRELSQALNE